MFKGLRFGLGASVMQGLLAAAHAMEPLSLVTNHATVLAYTDGAVPGMPLFTTFGSQMNTPMLADDGTVLFFSNLAGPQITAANSRALFQGTTPADLSVLAQWSDPAPGLPGLSLINNAGNSGISQQPSLSPDGRSLFASRLTNAGNDLPTTNDTALFGGFAGSLALVAREGDPAPGTNGALFDDLAGLSTQFIGINRNGRVVFPAVLVGGDVVGTTNDFALYTGTPGALTIAVRKGDTMLPGPVTAAGFSVYGNSFFGNNQMAGDRILYNLILSGAGVSTTNDESLWLYTPGSGNALLLREGDPAPGTAGAVFGGASQIDAFELPPSPVTANGRFIFYTGLTGGGTTEANNGALYIADTTGAATLLAREGSPAPGTDATFNNFNIFQSFVNSAGAAIFTGALTGGTVNATNDDGLWAGTPGSLSLVARSGVTAIPGAPSGSTCEQIVSVPIDFSDFGVVFQCNLIGPNVFPGRDSRALLAWTPAKGLFMFWRQGQDLEVAPDMFKRQILAGTHQMNNTDGRALGLSHTGMLVLHLVLDPGTGIATVDLNCYPTTDYYQDVDGDGHGDPTTELNLCAGGFPPPGYITTSGDCLDSNASALGATTETCNEIDDDCNARIDDGVPHPTGVLTMTMAKSAGNTTLSWNAVPNAIHYDVISGDLGELRAAGALGYQYLSQAQCSGNDVTGTSMFTGPNPTAGNGQFFLMRAVGCTGLGSYDEGVPSQVGARNAQITAALYSCP